MAYRAEIEIGVKGVRSLEQLRSEINKSATAAESLNNVVGARGGLVQNIQNYVNNLNKVAFALQLVTIGTKAETTAIKQYVTAEEQANAVLQRKLKLIDEEKRKREEVRRVRRLTAEGIFETTRFRQPIGPQPSPLQGQSSVVGERIARTIAQRQEEAALQKALLALEQRKAAELNKQLQVRGELNAAVAREVNLVRAGIRPATQYAQAIGPQPARAAGRAGARGGGSNRLGGVVSNAVIGGAFPLLFGQGGGAATGGALGGALGGLLGGTGGFAGSLLGTLLGGIAEQGGKIKELAADIGFSAEQTRNLQEAFKLAGTDAEKFTAAVQNIRGLGLELNDQASVVQALTQLTAAYGGSIDKTANAFTSALESGKVTQATLNQLTSQNIPIQDKLAASYNVTRSELLQMAKDGKISVQDLANAFVDLANESAKGPGKTRTAYEEAFEQISLAVDNLTTKIIASFDLQADKAQSTGETLVTRIAGAFTNILRSIEPVVLLLSQTTGALVNLGISAVNALSGIPNLISNVTSSVIGMIPGLGASYKILSAIAALRQNGGRAPGIASPTNLNQGMSQNWPAGIPRPGTTPQIDRIRVPSQLPSEGSTGAKPKKDKTAEELQRSLEQGRALAQEFARQVKLLNTTTDIERKRLQIQFDFEDRQKQISELKNAEQRTSLTTQNQEIRRLELIDLQTEALKKQTDEAEKLFDIIIQGYNFGISREGGTGAGIFGKLSELKQNLDPVKVQVDSIATGATVIGDAFSLAFGEIISGAKSTEQALADTFQQIGDAFINMALNIIAQQMTMIILGSILKALGLGFNLSGTNALSTGSSPLGGIGGSLGGAGYGGVSGITPIGPSFGGATFPAFFADGGFVTGPTNAVVGEGGQAEYIIPASKMRSAMSRYAAGARGSAVIPAGDDTSSGGGTATMAPAAIDVRYTVERINSVDYVTADQFRTGMAQAAQQGATQGEQRTLRRLQQSRATRSRLGMN